MSKMKLLLSVVADLQSLAESIQAVADVIGEGESPGTIKHQQNQEETGPQKADKPKHRQEHTTLEMVRAVLAQKSQNGLTADVRTIIQKYGGNKLSEVDPKNYGDILKDAEGLGNG